MKTSNESVTYSVVSHKNPQDINSPERFYAQAQARGEIDLNTICERIQHSCTISKPDIYGVLTALESVMTHSLANGEIVRLGDFGTFQVSIGSNGAPAREDFDDSYIRRTRYLFRPGGMLKELQANMKFEKVPVREKKTLDE